MTLGFIFAAVALILAGGWALTRASRGPKALSPPRGGDQVLMDQSPVGALLLDPALRVAWANDTFCDLFDLTRSELIGRGFVDVVRQELKDLVEEPDVVESSLLEAYESAAEASPFDFSVRARNGRDQRWIEHTCQVIEKKPLVGGVSPILSTLRAGRASPLLNTPRMSRNSTRSWSTWLAGAADLRRTKRQCCAGSQSSRPARYSPTDGSFGPSASPGPSGRSAI